MWYVVSLASLGFEYYTTTDVQQYMKLLFLRLKAIKPFLSGQLFSFFLLNKNRIVPPWERERSKVLSLCHRNEVVTIQQKNSPYFRQINTIHCSQDHLVPLGFFRFDVKHLDGNTKILSDWILQAWYHASWFYKLF